MHHQLQGVREHSGRLLLKISKARDLEAQPRERTKQRREVCLVLPCLTQCGRELKEPHERSQPSPITCNTPTFSNAPMNDVIGLRRVDTSEGVSCEVKSPPRISTFAFPYHRPRFVPSRRRQRPPHLTPHASTTSPSATRNHVVER